MTRLYSDGWRCGSQVDRKATERVYAGGKDTERVEDGPDSIDMESRLDRQLDGPSHMHRPICCVCR